MFITFEGIEGAGKSTQIERLALTLQENGHPCLLTREPGATSIGKKIREILLSSNSKGILPLAELLLYEADRAQHIHEVIRPALSDHKIVISDRFYDATIVYQGYARGFDLTQIDVLHTMVVGTLKPDLTLLLDLPVEKGLDRAWKRIESRTAMQREDRFESEAFSFHEKVRAGYLKLAKTEPQRFRLIDASADPDRVHEKILETVFIKLDERNRTHKRHDGKPTA